MRHLSLRVFILVALFSIAAPTFASPQRDTSGAGGFFSQLIRVVRHLLPLGDPTFPKP
jgi:hypothetical protein